MLSTDRQYAGKAQVAGRRFPIEVWAVAKGYEGLSRVEYVDMTGHPVEVELIVQEAA